MTIFRTKYNWPNSMMTALLGFAILFTSTARADEPKPLFQNDDVISIRIEGPFKQLLRKAKSSTDPYPATLVVDGANPEQHAIMLSARGNSRRSRGLCTFPPLRVEFSEKPGDDSLFDGQKRLKLVTHCKGASAYQQYYLLEYTAYKLLNVLTPNSLNVRMADIAYIEEKNGKTNIERMGFFIEDTDDAAKRIGMKEIDLPDITVEQIAPTSAAQYALFQYMIGNLDWSMHNGPAGNDCCHNTKLIGATKDAQGEFIPVPYDFDYSGLVDTPYAVAPPGMRIDSVRKRRYRGFCRHNDEVRAQAALFRENRDALNAAIQSVPGLNDRNKKSSIKYLDRFFNDIEDDDKLNRRLFSVCRD